MNSPSRYERLQDLFAAALELDQVQRLEFLRAECREDPSLLSSVVALIDGADDPGGRLDELSDGSTSGTGFGALISRLARHRPSESRYELIDVIGQGAMGIVFKVWDRDLARHLAMKVALASDEVADGGESSRLARFLAEAQITGQLDHPGIVPVHEIGVDDLQRCYFTMKLVQGHTLLEVLAMHREGRTDWNQPRVLGVLLSVGQALAFAHARGVIHRDIKPSNIMVGRFGEAYVMDWGLGRVLASPDPVVHTCRDPEVGGDDSDVLTRDGDTMGTPAYMPPEQARGEFSKVDQHADVYSLGAILYEFLGGRAPYMTPGRRMSSREIVRAVVAGPPVDIERIAPHSNPELVAIAGRAMSRDPATRYANAGELADDLRAFLEGRIVRAHRTGPIVELRKWILRNRGVAAAIAVAIMIAIISGFMLAGIERSRRTAALRAGDTHRAAALVAAAPGVWPASAEQRAAAATWLAEARRSVASLPEYHAELRDFERDHSDARRLAVLQSFDPESIRLDLGISSRARRLAGIRKLAGELPDSESSPDLNPRIQSHDDQVRILRAEVPLVEQELASLRGRRACLPDPMYEDADLERMHRQLVGLVANLELMARPEVGLIDRIAERLSRSTEIERASAPAWDLAIATIADRALSPQYDGLRISRQDGLVPIGVDPTSGLYEFWHHLSGDRPIETGRGLSLHSETGIVLVLIPGGTFAIGAQNTDPAEPNYVDIENDPDIKGFGPSEKGVRSVQLDPYFISKFEMTQGQWFRAATTSPSRAYAGARFGSDPRYTRTHPVEQVSWLECAEILHAWSLTFPTEAQWERAARGGLPGAYGAGAQSADQILHGANFADLRLTKLGKELSVPVSIDDGFGVHAPADQFGGHPFGLFGVRGNVGEWCLDWFADDCATVAVRAGTGELQPDLASFKAIRGGSFLSAPGDLRVTRRTNSNPDQKYQDVGVRPCRSLLP